MGYYPWVFDNYRLYVEMRSERQMVKRNYHYKYFIKVYALSHFSQNNRWTDFFNLSFSSKRDARQFFDKFSPKFYAARNGGYNQETNRTNYIPISLEQVIQMMNETIKESNYSPRKAKKLYESMLMDF